MDEWLIANSMTVVGGLTVLCLALVLIWAGEAAEINEHEDKVTRDEDKK
jgi:hypothetical protein